MTTSTRFRRLASAEAQLSNVLPQREPIAIITHNSDQAMTWILAALNRRYPLALIGAGLRDYEIVDAVAAAQPRLIIDLSGRLQALLPDQFVRVTPETHNQVPIWRSAAQPNEDWANLWGEDALFAQLTSGSSGPSRLAVRTRVGVEAEMRAVTERLKFQQSDRILCVSSVAHSYALIGGLLCAQRVDATVALATHPHEALQLLESFRPTLIFGLGSTYQHLLEIGTESQWHCIAEARWVLSAGAPLPSSVFDSVLARSGVAIHQDYGTTETGTISIDDDVVPLRSSVGRPLPHVEVRISDGEIHVRSEAVASRYLTLEGPRRIALHDDWYATGDLGTFNGRSMELAGRRRDIVQTPRGPIALAELEAALLQVSGIAAVAVIRISLLDGSSGVRAVVVPLPGCNLELPLAELPAHLMPHEIVFRDALPTSPAGKILIKYLERE